MNGESAFGWIKAGAVLVVLAVVAYIAYKGYSAFKNLFGGISSWWTNEKAAFAARKADFAAGAARPPDAPYTIKENDAGAATGIVLPMRRRASGTSSDANSAQYSPNPSPFTDENTNYL